ncbi:hypothetical protein Aperf_G00000106626 [Anoplocephala perfoliata]
MARNKPRQGQIVTHVTRLIGQKMTNSSHPTSTSFFKHKLSTSSVTQNSNEINTTRNEKGISRQHSSGFNDTCVASRTPVDSGRTEESTKPFHVASLYHWKTNFTSIMPERQNNNADSEIRNTLADIRRSLDAIPHARQDAICGDLYQECDNGGETVLVDLLQEIRDSLRAMPYDEVQPSVSPTVNNEFVDTNLLKVLEDIREGVFSLREATKERMADDKTLSSRIKPISKSEPNSYRDSLLIDSILEIRKGVAALVDNIKAQENKEIDEVFGAVGDIRRSLQIISDGEVNRVPPISPPSFNNAQANALLEKSASAIVQSINGLVGTVNKISHQLEARKEEPVMLKNMWKKSEEEVDSDKEKLEKSPKRKKKMKKEKRTCRRREDEKSNESECTCEKLLKYLIDQKEEQPVRPCQYILPSIQPPPIYIAPVCRQSPPLPLPPPQLPSATPESAPEPPPPAAPSTAQANIVPAPIICLPMTCYQTSQPAAMLPPCQHQCQSPPSLPNFCCQHQAQKQPQSSVACRNYQVQSPTGSKGRLVKSLPASFTLSFTGNTEQKSKIWNEKADPIPDYANRIFLCKEIDP